jgi:hypothetical protein
MATNIGMKAWMNALSQLGMLRKMRRKDQKTKGQNGLAAFSRQRSAFGFRLTVLASPSCSPPSVLSILSPAFFLLLSRGFFFSDLSGFRFPHSDLLASASDRPESATQFSLLVRWSFGLWSLASLAA